MKKVEFVRGECEWEGLYIDGELVEENHSLDAEVVLKALMKAGIIKVLAVTTVKQDYMDDIGSLPKKGSEIENVLETEFTMIQSPFSKAAGMMKSGRVFLSSDNHFFHTNIIKYCNRPFADANEMNVEMERRWNEVVQPDDIVVVVGDLTAGLGDKKIDLFHLIGRLNGRKILVRGNHDHQKDAFYLEAGFKRVVEHMFMGGALFTHFPAREDKEYPHPMHKRAMKWQEEYQPKIIIHGHEHGAGNPEHPGHFNCAADRHDYTPFPLRKALESHNLIDVELDVVAALENFLAE